MNMQIESLFMEFEEFVVQPNAMRSLVILLASIIVAYLLSHVIARIIIKIAQKIALRSDTATNEEKKIKLRRVETYLSVSIAAVRALIVGIVAFYSWQLISTTASLSAATIGASAFFIVIAGGTLGLVLRDVTSGAAMIIERWFDVGDFVQLEPFLDVSGVVERITLRSTKLRNLSGEVIWVHNQHIHGVKVTPRGLRTLAVDIFVNNEKVGRNLIEKVLATIPVDAMTVAEKPKIIKSEQWGEHLWLMTVTAQTPPGREWIIESYLVESLKDQDAKRRGGDTMVRRPMVRYADPAAEKSFRRAIRISKNDSK